MENLSRKRTFIKFAMSLVVSFFVYYISELQRSFGGLIFRAVRRIRLMSLHSARHLIA